MVIKRSSAREIDSLVADLDADDEGRREAAVARLAVIGARAASALLGVVRGPASPRARVAAMQALEAVPDGRVLDRALACLDDPDSAVAVQAAALASTYVESRDGPRAIDRLAAVAVDASRERSVRLASLEALADMAARTVRPIWRRLQDDADGVIRRRARLALGLEDTEPDPLAVLEAAAEGTLPDDPRALAAAVAEAGGAAPLPTLHRVLESLRGVGRAGDPRSRDPGWVGVGGALHLSLALRGSTVALYDLRETFERAAAPLPAEFVTALAAVGDRTCLDAIAAAYARAPRAPGARDWWRSLLAGAFRDIVEREGLNERHAVIKRVRTRWPDAARALLGPARRASR